MYLLGMNFQQPEVYCGSTTFLVSTETNSSVNSGDHSTSACGRFQGCTPWVWTSDFDMMRIFMSWAAFQEKICSPKKLICLQSSMNSILGVRVEIAYPLRWTKFITHLASQTCIARNTLLLMRTLEFTLVNCHEYHLFRLESARTIVGRIWVFWM